MTFRYWYLHHYETFDIHYSKKTESYTQRSVRKGERPLFSFETIQQAWTLTLTGGAPTVQKVPPKPDQFKTVFVVEISLIIVCELVPLGPWGRRIAQFDVTENLVCNPDI